MTPAEILAAAERLIFQAIPNPSEPGRWYPAQLPNGKNCEIRTTQARGANTGLFLHLRYPVRLVLRDAETDHLRDAGQGWRWYRISLRHGTIDIVE